MNKIALSIIIIIGIIFIMLSLQISSLLDIKTRTIEVTETNFAVFGALIALGTGLYNACKFIYINIIYSPLSVSCYSCHDGENKYTFEVSFKNNTDDNIIIKIAELSGFNLTFSEISLPEKANKEVSFSGSKADNLKTKKAFFNVHRISFRYKDSRINKYKTKKCIIKYNE